MSEGCTASTPPSQGRPRGLAAAPSGPGGRMRPGRERGAPAPTGSRCRRRRRPLDNHPRASPSTSSRETSTGTSVGTTQRANSVGTAAAGLPSPTSGHCGGGVLGALTPHVRTSAAREECDLLRLLAAHTASRLLEHRDGHGNPEPALQSCDSTRTGVLCQQPLGDCESAEREPDHPGHDCRRCHLGSW